METIFSRLRSMETQGQPLHALIVEACDVGDELVEALDPSNVRNAANKLALAGNGLSAGLLILMADAQDRALARAYVNNGHTPDNGKVAA
jgi:hypothetical protein